MSDTSGSSGTGSSGSSSGSGSTGSGSGPDCGSVDGAGAQLLCLISDPFAVEFRGTAVWTALGTSLGFMLLIMIAFSLIRPRNSVVYAPRLKFADDKHAPPSIGRGVFDWLPPVFKLREPELRDKIGLDATIFLRFTKMCRNIFLVVTVVACGLILPANIITSGKNSQVSEFKAKGRTGFWAASTPQYMHGNALWVHVVAAWLINVIVAFFLWRNYVAVVRLRRAYYESPEYVQSLHSRSLMVTDIPTASRTDEGILRLTDQVEQTSSIPQAAIARNVKDLPDLIEQHGKAVRELESVLAKYLKNPEKAPGKRPTMRPNMNKRRGIGSERVDSIDHLIERIQSLEMEIKHVRKTIDRRDPMPYGFAAYETLEEAHSVAHAAKKKHPQGATISLATKPSDIIWNNLALSKQERRRRRYMNTFWVAVLTVIWIGPNALIAIFLSNLSNLANVWKGFQKSYESDPKGWAIVQGVASPALTSLVYILLPIAFRRMSNRSGDLTKTSRERHVATRLYSFFVFNNLIVFSIFSAIWTYVTNIINSSKRESVWDAIREGYFFQTILGGMVEVTTFWITWLLQRNLGSATDLAQMIQLIWVWYGRTFTSPTPRQQIELTAPCSFDYAIYHNYFLFYSTVALCFTTLQPIVIPITAFYFAIDYWLKKYLLLYVLITKHESGGQSWRILYNRMVFAVMLADLVFAVVIKANGTWVMVGVMAPMPLLLLGFKYWCARTYDDRMDYYLQRRDAEIGKARRNDRLASKFRHPALISKLMTPMVHEYAAHALSQIYRGRGVTNLDPDIDGLPLDPMSQSQPGKTVTRFNTDSPSIRSKASSHDFFEFVPSHKLDFGYYKNRAEFADEYGGDGELFGRPADLVSERSGSPVSFLTGGRPYTNTSPGSSRASSPSGSPRGYGRTRTMSPAATFHTRNNSSGDLSYRRAVGTSNVGTPNMGPQVYRGRMGSESETNLLRAAQPVGFSAPGAGVGASPATTPYYDPEVPSDPLNPPREYFGLDRWRAPQYSGIPGGEVYGGAAPRDAYSGVPGAGYGGSAGHGRQGSGTGYESYRQASQPRTR